MLDRPTTLGRSYSLGNIARAKAVADRATCDKPPSQFFEEWLRVYRQALREFSSEQEQADDHRL